MFSRHCKSCRTADISEDKIEAIPHWAASEVFAPAERAVLAYADALVYDGGRVADGVFNALRTEFDDRDEPTVEIDGPDGSRM